MTKSHKKNGGKYTGDIICKMEKQYFVFDVKLKLFREDKNMNMFTVTNNEIVNHTNEISKVLVLADVAWKPNDNEMMNVEFNNYDLEKWKNH